MIRTDAHKREAMGIGTVATLEAAQGLLPSKEKCCPFFMAATLG